MSQSTNKPTRFFSLLLAVCLAASLAVFAQSGRKRPETNANQPAPRPPRRVIYTERPAVNANVNANAPTPETDGTMRPRRANDNANNNRSSEVSAPIVGSGVDTRGAPVFNSETDALGAPPVMPTPVQAISPGGSDREETVGADDIVRVNSSLVAIPTSVVGADGRAIANLRTEDFELRVDGQLRPVSDLVFANTPVRLALLFDNSSSLREFREFEKQAAIRFFKRVLRPQDQAAVFSISTDAEMMQPLTSDVGTLTRTIENFGKPDGATAFYDAILLAADYLRPFTERKVIVIVSDGEETSSMHNDFDLAVRRAQLADCQVYGVQTGLYENANLRQLAAERRMQELAAQTGGAVYVPRTDAELDRAFTQIAADLAQQYILSYYPPSEEPRDGRFREIALRVKNQPNARVRTRKGYYATKAKARG